MSEEEILNADECVVAIVQCYRDLVGLCDRLADMSGLDRDDVLREVMPGRAAERRDHDRIGRWYEENRPEIMEAIDKRNEAFLKEKEREELLASLNLTDDQKRILFGE